MPSERLQGGASALHALAAQLRKRDDIHTLDALAVCALMDDAAVLLAALAERES